MSLERILCVEAPFLPPTSGFDAIAVQAVGGLVGSARPYQALPSASSGLCGGKKSHGQFVRGTSHPSNWPLRVAGQLLAAAAARGTPPQPSAARSPAAKCACEHGCCSQPYCTRPSPPAMRGQGHSTCACRTGQQWWQQPALTAVLRQPGKPSDPAAAWQWAPNGGCCKHHMPMAATPGAPCQRSPCSRLHPPPKRRRRQERRPARRRHQRQR